MDPKITADLVTLWQSLTWGDAVVASILLMSLLAGFWSGFVWQMLRIVAVLVAYWLAAQFHPLVSPYMGSAMSAQTRVMLSYLAVFAGVALAAYLLMVIERNAVESMPPETSDRLLGAALGVVKGFLICGVVAVGVLRYAEDKSMAKQTVADSKLAQFAGRFVDVIWIGPADESKKESRKASDDVSEGQGDSAALPAPAATASGSRRPIGQAALRH